MCRSLLPLPSLARNAPPSISEEPGSGLCCPAAASFLARCSRRVLSDGQSFVRICIRYTCGDVFTILRYRMFPASPPFASLHEDPHTPPRSRNISTAFAAYLITPRISVAASRSRTYLLLYKTYSARRKATMATSNLEKMSAKGTRCLGRTSREEDSCQVGKRAR